MNSDNLLHPHFFIVGICAEDYFKLNLISERLNRLGEAILFLWLIYQIYHISKDNSMCLSDTKNTHLKHTI